jgi:signal transduction histidine kinase/ActR/RegA family two-component response regulator
MVGEETGGFQERPSGTWRGAMASAGAVLATLLLFGLLFMVNQSNATRDTALESERHSYDVMLLTRTVDGSVARAEAALGRYVTDEVQTTGTLYYNEWLLAAQQIRGLERLVHDNPQQYRRVVEAKQLFDQRAHELGAAAAAARTKKGQGGLPLFFQAGKTPTGNALSNKLAEIGAAERSDLITRMATTRRSSDLADQLTRWFGLLAALIGVGAIGLGIAAFRAMAERLQALRDADSEASRAALLETAVAERTCELRSANEQLKAEAAERAAAEAQLRQVQKMEAVGQLTGGIAHDFNNMLAVVVGGIDLARRRLSGSRREVELHLDNAQEGATRAAALTRRLLAFARSEPLLPVPVSPCDLVEGMLDLVDRSIGERITVRTHFPETRWAVKVDTNQFENAILNMAVNARDAMEGDGQLSISLDNVSVGAAQVGALAPGDYVRISVSDTGSGIRPELLERVFEPFFTTKPVGKGTGLGLSQIFAFARQSEGDVTIDSVIGAGTTVSLYLPRSQEAVEAVAEARQPAHRALAEAAHRGHNVRVLVVEDDPRVSRSTVAALEELGYRPIPCSSGREALDILEHEDGIDLIITDVMMPEMTGPELVHHAMVRYPWIAVLFVTGYVGETGDADALSGRHILRKPFTVAGLSNAVAAALDRRASELPPASAA